MTEWKGSMFSSLGWIGPISLPGRRSDRGRTGGWDSHFLSSLPGESLLFCVLMAYFYNSLWHCCATILFPPVFVPSMVTPCLFVNSKLMQHPLCNTTAQMPLNTPFKINLTKVTCFKWVKSVFWSFSLIKDCFFLPTSNWTDL